MRLVKPIFAEEESRDENGLFEALEETLRREGFPADERRLFDAAIAVAKRLKEAQEDVADIVKGYLFSA